MEAMPEQEAMKAMPTQEATAAATHPKLSSVNTLLPSSSSSHGIETFIFTALAVLAAYAHLLMINISYIKLAIIPVIMLSFISAVGGKFYYPSGRSRQYYDDNNDDTGTGSVNRVRELLVASAQFTFMPQLLLLLCSGLDKFLGLRQQQQQNDDDDDDSCFLVSQFLFFFSSAIGALQVMMDTMSVGVANKVFQVLQMIFRIVLNMALHAKVAEWVGEDTVLVCMPEIVAALLWFIDHFDHSGLTVSICFDKVKSFKFGVTILGASAAAAVAVFLSKFAYEVNGNIVVSTDWWCTRVFVSCTLSGMLSYFSMWMLSESHGSGSAAKVLPIQILELSAYVCFGTAAVGVSVLAILHPRLDVFFNLVETVTGFIDVEAAAAQVFVLAVFGCLMSVHAFLFMALGNKMNGGGASSSSTSSRLLLLGLILSRVLPYVKKFSPSYRDPVVMIIAIICTCLMSWLPGQRRI